MIKVNEPSLFFMLRPSDCVSSGIVIVTVFPESTAPPTEKSASIL